VHDVLENILLAKLRVVTPCLSESREGVLMDVGRAVRRAAGPDEIRLILSLEILDFISYALQTPGL
jgi:hypothetical protein